MNHNEEKKILLNGDLHLSQSNFELALLDFAELVERNPRNIQYLTKFSVSLIRLHRYHEAEKVIEEILSIDQHNLAAFLNLCSIYQATERFESSLKSAIAAIEIDPRNHIAYNNLGVSFGELGLKQESIEAFKIACDLAPDYFEVWINLAQTQYQNNYYEESLKTFEKILSSKKIREKNIALIKYFMSFALLQLGKVKRGFELYEFGLNENLPLASIRSIRKFQKPKWNGTSTEQTILVWREQGIGDEIEFSTCLTDLIRTGNKIIYETDARLIGLFQRIYPEILVRPEKINMNGESYDSEYDVQIAVGSLPNLFRESVESFTGSNIRFFQALDNLSIKFKERFLPYKQKKLVGICWRSGKLNQSRNRNYSVLSDWGEFASCQNIQLVNLQYGECEDEIIEFEEKFNCKVLRWNDVDLKNDIESVVAIIENLDCVVTAPTAVSSISANCGVKTYIIQRRSWMSLGQENYPWYKNVTVIEVPDAKLPAEMIPKVIELL